MSVNPMLDQIKMTPQALETAFEPMERDARLVLSTPLIYRIKRIVMIGSGDSYFAAKAAELAMLVHGGVPVEVRPPLEAGRYHALHSTRRDLENTLVIALSNSGAAARVCEAAMLYRRAGATVLAVTKNKDGRLAQAADHVLTLAVPAMPLAPGFGPYQFALSALLLLGVRLGEVRMGMTMDEAQALRGTLRKLYGAMGETIAASEAPARSMARKLASARLFEFVGSGPSRAVADYGAAKLLEASGRHALSADLEEWTHLNYFDRDPADIATLLVMPKGGRSDSRAEEVRQYMSRLGRNLAVVGEDLPLTGSVDELWSPILTSVPVALLAAFIAEADGAEYGRGSKGAWSDSSDASTVQRSAMYEAGK